MVKVSGSGVHLPYPFERDVVSGESIVKLQPAYKISQEAGHTKRE